MFEQNKTSSTGGGVGLGAGVGGPFGLGIAGGRSVTITELGKRVTPPDRKDFYPEEARSSLGLIVFLIAFPLAFYLSLVPAIALGLPGWTFFILIIPLLMAARWVTRLAHQGPPKDTSEERYQRAKEMWNRKYVCMQCGADYELRLKGNQRTLVPVKTIAHEL